MNYITLIIFCQSFKFFVIRFRGMMECCPAPARERCEALPRAPQGRVCGTLSHALPRPFWKKVLDPQNFWKWVWCAPTMVARCNYSPTASATMSPSKKNNALTSLVQARLGQALFFLLVLWTMAVREAICAQLWKQRIHKKICSNAVVPCFTWKFTLLNRFAFMKRS